MNTEQCEWQKNEKRRVEKTEYIKSGRQMKRTVFRVEIL